MKEDSGAKFRMDTFAKEWIDENKSGGKKFAALRQAEKNTDRRSRRASCAG